MRLSGKGDRLPYRRLSGIGILYEFGGKNYVVTAAAYDRYGHINQVIMTRLLLLLSIGGLSVLVIVGYMLAEVHLPYP